MRRFLRPTFRRPLPRLLLPMKSLRQLETLDKESAKEHLSDFGWAGQWFLARNFTAST
jgi:hypothetical protein